METNLYLFSRVREKVSLTVLHQRGIYAILGPSQAQGLLFGAPASAGLPAGATSEERSRAWRSEQPDTVMGSGPVVASRCPRLANRRVAQTTILVGQDGLSYGEAVGHPTASRR